MPEFLSRAGPRGSDRPDRSTGIDGIDTNRGGTSFERPESEAKEGGKSHESQPCTSTHDHVPSEATILAPCSRPFSMNVLFEPVTSTPAM